MNWYTVAWVSWLLFFAVVEGRALANRTDGDTLSEHVWRWFRVHDPRPTGWVIAARAVLALFLAWLLFHFVFGWFTPTHPTPW